MDRFLKMVLVKKATFKFLNGTFFGPPFIWFTWEWALHQKIIRASQVSSFWTGSNFEFYWLLTSKTDVHCALVLEVSSQQHSKLQPVQNEDIALVIGQ